jgi:hypothetical protein
LVFGTKNFRDSMVEILILRRIFFRCLVWNGIEYEPVIAEWVEEVLKRGVSSTLRAFGHGEVEEVLKLGVSSTGGTRLGLVEEVEEVLKRGVSSTRNRKNRILREVEEVLNNKL